MKVDLKFEGAYVTVLSTDGDKKSRREDYLVNMDQLASETSKARSQEIELSNYLRFWCIIKCLRCLRVERDDKRRTLKIDPFSEIKHHVPRSGELASRRLAPFLSDHRFAVEASLRLALFEFLFLSLFAFELLYLLSGLVRIVSRFVLHKGFHKLSFFIF